MSDVLFKPITIPSPATRDLRRHAKKLVTAALVLSAGPRSSKPIPAAAPAR